MDILSNRGGKFTNKIGTQQRGAAAAPEGQMPNMGRVHAERAPRCGAYSTSSAFFNPMKQIFDTYSMEDIISLKQLPVPHKAVAGSFKNWKPIGELGFCQSRMAKRIHWWIERWLELCFWNDYNGCSGHLVGHLTHNCHFWKLRCRKSARRCGGKHTSKSKCKKTHQLRTTFGSWDVEKVHAVVARSTFRSQKWKKWGVRSTFGRSDVVCVAGTRNFEPCQRWTKHEGFVAVSTTTTTTTTTLHSTTLQLRLQLQLHLHYATLHTIYITLQNTPLHYVTLTTSTTTLLHYTTLR